MTGLGRASPPSQPEWERGGAACNRSSVIAFLVFAGPCCNRCRKPCRLFRWHRRIEASNINHARTNSRRTGTTIRRGFIEAETLSERAHDGFAATTALPFTLSGVSWHRACAQESQTPRLRARNHSCRSHSPPGRPTQIELVQKKILTGFETHAQLRLAMWFKCQPERERFRSWALFVRTVMRRGFERRSCS